MDRELALAALTLAMAGPLLFAAGAWRQPSASATGARQGEQACWKALWTPAYPALVGLFTLLGWAALEPRDAELLPGSILAVSALFAGIWMRAFTRAVKSAYAQRPQIVAGTVGLWRPRTVLSHALIAQLDVDALEAARAHEAAHLRHRDPLRIWLAQLVTDLQWPWPGPCARFDEWRRVLELARDEEARCAGIDGADLAAAILSTVRMTIPSSRTATLIATRSGLEERIERLLAPLHVGEPTRRCSKTTLVVLVSMCVVGAISGLRFGEVAIQMIVSTLP